MFTRLQKAWDKVTELWYTPYYLGLYGSQNYNIDTETSDFDYKCIILPTLNDLVYQNKPVSISVEFEGGLIDIKDIRTYIESAVKVNVNFIEILNTDHYLWDPEIRKFFKPLLDELGNQYLRATMWMIMQKFTALKHPYPSKEYELATFWYDPKQLCHIIRLRHLMERYLRWNYSYDHQGIERDMLMSFKRWVATLDRAEELAKWEISIAEQLLLEYKKEDIYDTKYRLIEFSREIVKNNILKNAR